MLWKMRWSGGAPLRHYLQSQPDCTRLHGWFTERAFFASHKPQLSAESIGLLSASQIETRLTILAAPIFVIVCITGKCSVRSVEFKVWSVKCKV